MKTKNMITPHLRNSINPLPWRYGFFLIALVCLALFSTASNVSAGTVTLRSGLVFSGHPTSIQLPAQGSQEDRHQPIIIVFDAPGAAPPGTQPQTINQASGQGTQAQSINDSGVIDGFYNDASGVAHGFVRARNGAITTYDAPCAGTGAGQGTAAFAINSEGEITGFDLDNSNVFHGFLRSPCDKDHEDAEACD